MSENGGEPLVRLLEERFHRQVEDARQFDDTSLEYRRLFSEAWGTFLLVVVAAGAGVVGAQVFGSDLTLAMKALAPGMMVMGIIFFMGTISGAHLNPAVTIAFAVRGNFPWLRVPGYIAAQFVGAVLACLLLQWSFGGIMAGATVPAAGVSAFGAASMEALLTAGLVSVILGTATGARNIGIAGAIAVGSYIGLVSVWGAPVTGASMNPMRSFAPALVGWDFTSYWAYLVGPLVGAMVAVFFEWILRGKPTKGGAAAAQGTLSQSDPAGL
ncbi:MAG: aquaporin [Micrococcales bacterium]|nr:aquaporin [Micrococcales bacterium]